MEDQNSKSEAISFFQKLTLIKYSSKNSDDLHNLLTFFSHKSLLLIKIWISPLKFYS